MRPVEVPGLPAGVGEHFESEGIEELYPPQEAAVEAGVTEGESVVAAVPTASGKTMIAELAMLSTVFADDGDGSAGGTAEAGDGSAAGDEADAGTPPTPATTGGTALYIVPLRALAGEKASEFERFEDLGLDVGISTGNYEARGEWLGDKDVIVATSEKVDSLVRNGAPWIDDLDCVVADEVHLLDDGERGPTLEVTLAKLRAQNPALQTVALSATVDNADEIADWLGAGLVESDWRPIELRRGVHYGNAAHFEGGEQREIPVRGSERQEAAVVRDTLADDGSTLVFVNSRRNAEAAADRLADVVEPMLGSDDRDRLADLADEIRDAGDTETGEDLADAVERGGAFHHAGLSSEHRGLVEDAFRDRLIRVICATPTLAAGVNTPARRVVVRDWRRYDATKGGMAPLDVLEVHQMMGRAGRPDYDDYGEALLLADSHDELEGLFDRYVYADPEPVRSKLAAEPALRTHVLATVASDFARTRSGLLEFLDRTLYAAQSTEAGRLERVTDEVVTYLETNDFLERTRSGDDERLAATALGHVVSELYLDPMSAAEIVDGLRAWEQRDDKDAGRVDTADGGTDHTTDGPTALGLYHLVARTPDMYELYLKSGEPSQYTELCYEREPELLGATPSEFEEGRFEDWLAALKTATLLEDWADEQDQDRITDRYGIGPGDLRGKVDTAEWLLGAAERLAGELELDCTPAIRAAKKRVEHGVREDLLELVGVRQVGRKRARRLYEAGIETREDLRTVDKGVVLWALDGRRRTAETVLENVGREDPSMEGVAQRAPEDVDAAAAGTAGTTDDPAETVSTPDDADGDQASLGDFS